MKHSAEIPTGYQEDEWKNEVYQAMSYTGTGKENRQSYFISTALLMEQVITVIFFNLLSLFLTHLAKRLFWTGWKKSNVLMEVSRQMVKSTKSDFGQFVMFYLFQCKNAIYWDPIYPVEDRGNVD